MLSPGGRICAAGADNQSSEGSVSARNKHKVHSRMATLIFFWCLFGLWSAVVASNRGAAGTGWFLAGFLLGPLGVIWAYTLGKRCPRCASKASLQASACPHCGNSFLFEEKRTGGVVLREPEVEVERSGISSSDSRRCPYCAEMILAAAIKCRYCHSELKRAPTASGDN
jgi:hypothetical protein